MALSGDDDSICDSKHIYFINLLTLGFDVNAIEKSIRVRFHQDMFDAPNERGFEVIMHFFFQRLNSSHAKEAFRECYPIYDKKQEQLFRQACKNWLQNITKENPVFTFPVMSHVLLKKCGEKFYNFLKEFSTYVLMEVTRRDAAFLEEQVLPPPLKKHQNIHQLVSESELWRNYKIQEWILKEGKEMEKISGELINKYRWYKRDVKEHQRILAAVTETRNCSSNMVDGPLQEEYEEHCRGLHKWMKDAQCEWEGVEQFFARESTSWQPFNHLLSTERSTLCLRKDALKPVIPGILCNHADIQIEQDGKLSLSVLCELWNQLLHQLASRISSHGVAPSVVNIPKQVLALHEVQLDTLQAEIGRISNDLLPKLQVAKNTQPPNYHSPLPSDPTFGGHFLCPTPPIIFTFDEQDFAPVTPSNSFATSLCSTSFINNSSRQKRTTRRSPYGSVDVRPGVWHRLYDNCIEETPLACGTTFKNLSKCRHGRVMTLSSCTLKTGGGRTLGKQQRVYNELSYSDTEIGCGDAKETGLCSECQPTRSGEAATQNEGVMLIDERQMRFDTEVLGNLNHSADDLLGGNATNPLEVKKKYNASEELCLRLLDSPLSSLKSTPTDNVDLSSLKLAKPLQQMVSPSPDPPEFERIMKNLEKSRLRGNDSVVQKLDLLEGKDLTPIRKIGQEQKKTIAEL